MTAGSRISVELVPRSRSGLRREIAQVAEHLPSVDTINVPEFLRYSTRSWEGAAFARPRFRGIPHVRAIDLNPREPLPMCGPLVAHGMDELLVVSGDPPADMSHRVYNVDAEQAIRRVARELPHVRVYAGLDPYRQSFARERDYLERKLEAGAVGFFSQPFFDLRLMDAYADLIPDGVEMWWGATSVLSEGSYTYWESRNHAVFPRSFRPTLEWNRQFAADLLQFARDRGHHAYFMPIKTDVVEYLGGIL